MPDALMQYLGSRDGFGLARDALDLLITYYIFYRVALVLRGTRAIQVVFGVALLFVLYLVSQLLQLTTVLTLLSAVLSSAILIGVVVFQNDIRRGLMRVGARARFGSGQSLESKVIDNVVEAATALARHRTGAIITFEQDANLDEFVGNNKGHVIDAAVSKELLISLFIPEAMNQLHDGAVVIRDLRVAKAGVFFPMPDGGVSDDSFGSRHRAALGITEETDAVVIVVSEERGSISFCFNGNIIPNLDGPKLRAALEGVFVPKRKAPTSQSLWSRWFKRNEAATPTKPLSALRDAKKRSPELLEDALRKARTESPTDDAPQPLRKKRADDADAHADSRPSALAPAAVVTHSGLPAAGSGASQPSAARQPSVVGQSAGEHDEGATTPTSVPLRKKSGDETAPEPLRKKRPAMPESTRQPSVPPPAEVHRTPLRHLAPPPATPSHAAEEGGPVSLRHPTVPMPPAQQTPLPTEPLPSKPAVASTAGRVGQPLPHSDTPDSDVPSSSPRHTLSNPMPRAEDVNASSKHNRSERREGDA